MKNKQKYFIANIMTATVWLINGLFCKVLNMVPRHQQIVQTIFNIKQNHAHAITIIIGFFEILLALWILSNLFSKVNTYFQIIIVATMNVIEIVCTPHLLLWGTLNIVFALLFISFLFWKENVLNPHNSNKQ